MRDLFRPVPTKRRWWLMAEILPPNSDRTSGAAKSDMEDFIEDIENKDLTKLDPKWIADTQERITKLITEFAQKAKEQHGLDPDISQWLDLIAMLIKEPIVLAELVEIMGVFPGVDDGFRIYCRDFM